MFDVRLTCDCETFDDRAVVVFVNVSHRILQFERVFGSLVKSPLVARPKIRYSGEGEVRIGNELPGTVTACDT